MNKVGINIFLALAVGVLLYLVSHGNLMMAALIPGLLLVCKLVTVRGPLIYWALLAEFARLQLPISFTRNISIAFIFEVVFIAGELLNHFAGKEKLRFEKSSKLIFIFCLIVAVIAKIRGFGIYLLGSSEIGGMDYLILIVRLSFLGLAAAYANQCGLNIRKVYIYALIGALIHTAMNLIVIKMPGIGSAFIRFSSVNFYREEYGLRGGARIHALGDMTFVVMPFVMCVKSFMRRHILVLMCILLAALSGFRTAALVVVVVFCFAEIRIHGMKATKLAVYLLAGAILFGVLWAAAPSLDFRVQRALSSLPGFSERVSAEVSLSARSSTEWRLDLYRVCLRHIPDYLLVGRGLGSTVETTLGTLSAVTGSAELYYEIRAYHLAIFELLLDYGGLATLVFFAAFFSGLTAAQRRIKRKGGSSYDEKFATACLLAVLICLLTFLSDFRTTYSQMLIFSYLACAGTGVSRPEKSEEREIAPPVA